MTEDEVALEMVKLGYGKDGIDSPGRNLSFVAGFRSLQYAEYAVAHIDSYNDFSADTVIEALRKINNLTKVYEWQVGREGSPVIYIKSFDTPGDNADEIVRILQDAKADEIHQDAFKTRVWWD